MSSLTWVSHIRKLITRANRLFAQCMSWCCSEHLPLVFPSKLFHTFVLPSVLLCSGSVPAVRLLDRTIRRWSRCLLGWPRGSPIPAVHLESDWPDAQRQITGRLLSLFGRTVICAVLWVLVALFSKCEHGSLNVLHLHWIGRSVIDWLPQQPSLSTTWTPPHYCEPGC